MLLEMIQKTSLWGAGGVDVEFAERPHDLFIAELIYLFGMVEADILKSFVGFVGVFRAVQAEEYHIAAQIFSICLG